ncbi:MAG: ATP-binding cassette domain-containing protein [Ginsengibacter sp.]
MQTPSILVKDLVVKTQGITVLDGISFSLLSNQHLAILGRTESGKTTLAKAIAGKIHFSGNIFTGCRNIKGRHTRIELVEQRYSFKNLSGVSDFYYQQRFNSFDSGDAPTVLEELLKITQDSKETNNINSVLEDIGIFHLKNAPLIQLSSGEHKRFQLAKALLNPPQMLILDNPYTGLDILARKKLNKILEDISEKGTQIILIPGTFSIPDFITDIAFLQNKKMIFFGRKENYYAFGEDTIDGNDFCALHEDTNRGNEEKLIHSRETQIFYNTELLPASNENFQFETIVEMKNIHLNYGEHIILKNLNWKIEHGEKWLLKGRNGAGKSSLLSLLTGDHPQAYSNEIYLFGKRRGSGESIWDIKQKTGYISPELHAYFDKNITCFNAIGSGYFDTIGLFKKLSTTQHNNILQWLDFLQLSHVSKKPLHSISTGLQRMILLARALVKNPPLLVLDEPCQELDEKQSTQFVSLIDHICTGSNKTLIYVSHDISNVPSCIEKVLLLEKEGQKIYSVNQQAELAIA